ncbi:hypothetical protein [Flammeovirga sp. EKP202]|uniref:YobI family P-loop NTPase n=1 Tax=Flammeovirga sp. EKP202 TaxID=2770592 RepID=UPI00165FE6FD|nr:hypothetical protein [Flammeovirga sp. EKP202]MBD0403703.1 hypothetical protein [Flammeovirga sp. EKP202]
MSSNNSFQKYIFHILVSLDQLGNTIAGGNPDNTISARVGYANTFDKPKYYWKTFQTIINFTFYPVDGKAHCLEAYKNDSNEVFDIKLSKLELVSLFVFIVSFCIVISLVLYLLYALHLVKPKNKDGNDSIVSSDIYKLTPNSDDIEKNDSYIVNLAKGVLYHDDVKNIAVTGPYGAGKSTIIQAFKKYYKLKFIDVSLAYFSTNKESETNVDREKSKLGNQHTTSGEEPSEGDKKTEKNDLNKIESAIVQQILYKVDPRAIPFSKFDRILDFSWKRIISHVLFFSIWIHSILFVFLNKFYLTELSLF